MSLAISDFVKFTIATPGKALAAYNPNVLGLLTKDAPVSNYGSGAEGTATVSAGAVATATPTAGGGGYTTPPPVYVIPAAGDTGAGAVIQSVLGGGIVTGFTIVYGGTGYLTAPTLVIGNQFQIYNDPAAVETDFGASSETYALAQEIFSQSPNILSGDGFLVVYAMSAGDTLAAAIQAVLGQIYCGGFIYGGYTPSSAEVVAAAKYVQTLNPRSMLFAPTNLVSDLYPAGQSYTIMQDKYTWTRNVIHTDSALQARAYAAAYASRLMSTDFSGADTTITMNLKQLVGIPPDLGITETIANQCETAGVDFIALVANLSEVVSTGGNDYSDDIYNLTWLLNALTVATFNGLATTPTKIPQTEAGMSYLKSLVTGVLRQAVNAGFLAPGSWTTTTFGDPVTLIRNVADFGFYVYSQPVSQQAPVDRAARKAPLMQIAIKYSGAVQSVNGLIFVNP
jgi:hypothetical protein